MTWFQKEIVLTERRRGCHLITAEVISQIPELQRIDRGLLHVFIRHTSASLTLNENADPDVRHDLDAHLSRLAPDDAALYAHSDEGPDDMSAHIKTSLLGAGVTIPVRDGRLLLGTWQGLYLCEHREAGGPRSIVVTLAGEERH